MAKVFDLTDPQRKFAIESGIPVGPTKANGSIYPFAAMEVGQSFAIEGTDFRSVQNVRSAVGTWNRLHAPMKFVVRRDPRTIDGHRCWRVA